MWLCKQSNIYLLFMPAYTSYILQPLDLASFSIVKSRYREDIKRLAALDNAAPIKKQRFIKCYNRAQVSRLSTKVIFSG